MPSDDTTLQINALVPDISQSSGSIGRTATTAAIDGNGLVCRQSGLCLFHKITLSLIYQNSSLDMPFRIFSSSPHIKHNHIRISNKFCEPLHIYVLKILLATGRCQAKCS